MKDNIASKYEEKKWLIKFLSNKRLVIIIICVIIGSVFAANKINNDPQELIYKISRVVAPPSIFDIKELQVSEIGQAVNKRALFEEFIDNIKSEKLKNQFKSDEEFNKDIIIKRGRKIGETTSSVQISLAVKKPEAASKWLDGFIDFVARKTIEKKVEDVMQKIDDKKDEVMLKIDDIHAEASSGSKTIEIKIKKYEKAAQRAKALGVMESTSVDSLPMDKRIGDLLYLQGYWKLDAEVRRLKAITKRQIVDTNDEQEQLKYLDALAPDMDNIKVFYLEKIAKNKVLNAYESKQTVWSIFGGFIGFLVGMIISIPFKRKSIIK